MDATIKERIKQKLIDINHLAAQQKEQSVVNDNTGVLSLNQQQNNTSTMLPTTSHYHSHQMNNNNAGNIMNAVDSSSSSSSSPSLPSASPLSASTSAPASTVVSPTMVSSAPSSPLPRLAIGHGGRDPVQLILELGELFVDCERWLNLQLNDTWRRRFLCSLILMVV